MCRLNASSRPLKVTNFLITEKCDAYVGSVLQALVSGLPRTGLLAARQGHGMHGQCLC